MLLPALILVSCLLQKGEARTRLAISDQNSPDVHVYDVRGGSDDPIHTFQPHRSPVAALAYSPVRDTCISADQSGMTPTSEMTDFVPVILVSASTLAAPPISMP